MNVKSFEDGDDEGDAEEEDVKGFFSGSPSPEREVGLADGMRRVESAGNI